MSQADIEEAGEKVVLKTYKAKQGEMLNGARQRLLSSKVLKAKTFVKPERLSPTKTALRYHSFRCYYQILEWKNAHHNLTTEDWGWMKVDNKLIPKTTHKNAAPESLLKNIGCICSGDCSTMRCGCRRGGYKCSSVCGKCQLTECCNAENLPDKANELFL